MIIPAIAHVVLKLNSIKVSDKLVIKNLLEKIQRKVNFIKKSISKTNMSDLYLQIAKIDIDPERLEAYGPMRDKFHHKFAIMRGKDNNHYEVHVVQAPEGHDDFNALGVIAIERGMNPKLLAAGGNIHYMNGSSRKLVFNYDPDCYLLKPENHVVSREHELTEGIAELLEDLLEEQGIQVDGVLALGLKP